jgi:hypothetical protein
MGSVLTADSLLAAVPLPSAEDRQQLQQGGVEEAVYVQDQQATYVYL